MRLLHLEVSELRNLQQVKLDTDASYNIFYGNNGSGKTSLLEAIYLLALGRSFRTHQTKKIISHESEKTVIFAQAQSPDSSRTTTLGISRDRAGNCERHLAKQPVNSNAELAKALPLQLINTQEHFSLASAPKFRRQLMDWGVFHVEHGFFSVWQDYHRALKQRNALLRQQTRFSNPQVAAWNASLANSGEKLATYRQEYVALFSPILSALWKSLMPNTSLDLRHACGWASQEELSTLLERRYLDDQRLGHTAYGPHRADLHLLIDGKPAFDQLSQGQQKLLLYALRLAQGKLLHELSGKRCVYLLDDLPAELDAGKRRLLARVLDDLNTQVFITGIAKKDLSAFVKKPDAQLFHVEHGCIRPT